MVINDQVRLADWLKGQLLSLQSVSHRPLQVLANATLERAENENI